MTAKNSAKGDNVKNLLDEAAKLGTTTDESADEATVPAQKESGEKVTAERDPDGKLHITVSDADEDEEPTGKVEKVRSFLKTHKKAIIGGAVAALALALGVSVQKKRSTTQDEPAAEAEAVEPSEG